MTMTKIPLGSLTLNHSAAPPSHHTAKYSSIASHVYL